MVLDTFEGIEIDFDSCVGSDIINKKRDNSKNFIKLEKGINRINTIDENKVKANFGKFFIQIREKKDDLISPLFFYPIISDIEKNFSIKIDKSVKDVLCTDFQLLSALNDIKNNFLLIKYINFFVKDISFVTDPNEPDINTLTIFINIREENIKKVIEKRDIIIEELCKNLDDATDNRISIVNVFE